VTGSAAVIGAGIFGVTAALELAAAGIDVTLYEQRDGILTGATANNVFRVHEGYHYPRDLRTARQCRDGYKSFMFGFAEATAAVTGPGSVSHYAIAAQGSLTSAGQFTRHCSQLGLTLRPADLPVLVPGSVQACFEADEFYYDPAVLRQCAHERLAAAGVRTELGCTAAPEAIAREHDIVVVTAYAGLNEVLAGLGCPPAELQYELCEVAVADAPAVTRLSLVVMDGPFVSIAPYRDGLHLLYDVVHSVHARATGHARPDWRPGGTRFAAMLASARRFAELGGVRHAGSLYATRVVLPGMDATDGRPAKVWWAGPRVLAVLSGKVSVSADTAKAVAAQVTAKLGLRDELPA
jgi:glycine/D-amino acid oxidase-like deaminating enzyme